MFFADRELVRIGEIVAAKADQLIWCRGRLHTSRATGRQCFIVLRQQQSTIQGLLAASEKTSKQMVKFCAK